MKSTTAMLNRSVEHIKKVLDDAPTFENVYIRSSSTSKVHGRCLFDFEGLDPKSVAVGVAFDGAKPIGYYVVPGQMCPKILLVKPGAENSKWFPYWCDSESKLKQRILQVLAIRPTRAQRNLLSKLA